MPWWRWWPIFLLFVLTPVAYLFNPDVVITPTLRAKGFLNFSILILSGLAGTIEMFLWYVGWGGLGSLVAMWFEEDVNFAKKIAGEMKRDGYLDGIKIYFTRKYKKLNEKSKKFLVGLKATSYLTFFGFGCWPTPGLRVIADFVCGTARWRWCFIALCVGNLVKTAGLVFAWDNFFSFWGW